MNPADVESIQAFDTELKALMEKYSVKIEVAVEFPIYKIIPEEVKYALYLFNKHGGEFVPKYVKKEGGDNAN